MKEQDSDLAVIFAILPKVLGQRIKNLLKLFLYPI
jgi:hypothetical protein